MAVTTIWTEEMTVKSSETDFQKRLKLAGVFQWMQDVASNHANHLGVGYEAMLPRDLAWVLSRVKVRFHHFPGMDERVTVQTWPKGLAQKVFFMRDHRLTTPDGRLVAEGSSAYILVNPRLRRIAMPGSLDIPVPDNNGLAAIDETLEKIQPVEALSECLTLQAGYSAMDIMEHVNNARYIEWIADCFSMEEHRAARPAWLQINYINEIKPGETVTLYRGQRPGNPDGWYITGDNRTTGARAFEAELHWTRP